MINELPKRTAEYIQKDEVIKITFSFNREIINEIKTIPGRKYHAKKEKYWTAPLSIDAINILDTLDFSLDPFLFDFRDRKKISAQSMDDQVVIKGLGGTLFPFQAQGVNFIDIKNGRALVGDEMGLGKTVQALAWLQKYPEKRPAIIVCPSSLKLNWEKEARFWMSAPKTEILSGKTPYKTEGEILIINYDILKEWSDQLKKLDAEVMVFDEVHYLKNNKAQRTKAAKKLAKGIPHIIGLTGTPIVNKPIEILNAIQMIDKTVAPDRWHFLHRYCGAKHNGFGWDFGGASHMEELHEKLTTSIMIRRKKKDVLKDLPDKIRSFTPIELENRKEYQQAEANFIEFVKNQTEVDLKLKLRNQLGDMADLVSIDPTKLKELKEEKASKVNILTEIEGLKQLAVKGKLNQSIRWIQDYLSSGEKLVVMAVHKFVIDELMNHFGKLAVKVDGSVTGVKRNEAVEKFQQDDSIKLFVGNIQAAGVGLTLTASSTVAFLELPWTPGDVLQAEDRVHRIGQKESVSIYYLLAQNTIEERIAALIDKKRKILDAVLDGAKPDDTSLLSELMKSYQ